MRSKAFARFVVALSVAVGAIGAYSVTASADGRALEGAFCTTNAGVPARFFCMALTWNGVEYGTRNREPLALRPGTYWLTVNDPAAGHNFALRSCPDSDQACTTGPVEEVTTVAGTPGEVTVKLNLQHGTYRLLCEPHETLFAGMYVDFAVGGVGQTP